jgi:phage-related protein
MAITVRELLTVLGVRTDTPAVRQFDRAVSDTRHTMAQANVAAGGLTSSIKGLVASYIGFQTLAIASKSLLDTNVQVQNLKAGLEVATGSVEGANAAWEQLAQFTKETPFQLQEVAGAFVKLKNLGLDPSRESLIAYGNIAASFAGKSLNDFIEAVADASTGEFERLKEFGIKASSQGKKVTFTFRGVKTTVKKEAGEIEGFLKSLGEQEFAGAMEKQMDTLGGQISNLKDNLFLFQLQVGEAGVNAALKELLATIIGVSAESGDFADTLGKSLAAGIRSVTKAIQFLIDHAKEAKQILGGLVLIMAAAKVNAFAGALMNTVQALRAMGLAAALPAIKIALIAAAMVILGLAVQDFVVFMRGGDSLIGRLFKKVGLAPDTIKGIRNRIRSTIGSLVSWLRKTGIQLFESATKAFFKVLPIVIDTVRKITPIVVRFAQTLLQFGQRLFEFWLKINVMIVQLVIELVQRLVPFVVQLVSRIIGLGMELLPAVIEIVEAIMGAVVELLPVIIGIVTQIFDLVIEVVDAILPIVLELIDLIVPMIKRILTISVEVLKGILAVALPVISAMVESTKLFIEFVVNAISFGIDIFTTFVNAVISLWQAIQGPVLAVWDVIQTAIVAVITFIAELFNSVIESIMSVVNGLISGVNDIADTLGIGTISTFSASIGEVTVPIDGSTNMGPDEVKRATSDGLTQALREAQRATAA